MSTKNSGRVAYMAGVYWARRPWLKYGDIRRWIIEVLGVDVTMTWVRDQVPSERDV